MWKAQTPLNRMQFRTLRIQASFLQPPPGTMSGRKAGWDRMKRRSLWVVIAVLLAASLCLAAGKKKNETVEKFCNVSFVVLRDTSGKPIKNASVIVHGVKADGTQERDGFQLKTDAEGRTHMDDLPYGKYRIQAIVRNLQTYGEDFELNQPQQEITIRMKPPTDQVTIY